MDILSTLGVVSQGLRLVKEILPTRPKGAIHPTEASPNTSFAQVLLNRQDKNGDGTLTLGEVKFSDKLFHLIDSNGDGKLDVQELNAATPLIQNAQRTDESIMEYMKTHDADHNALISTIESGLEESLFSSIDQNNDKSINRAELNTAYHNQTLDLST